MKVAYFALGEQFNSRHAGYVHTYNIIKSLSKFIHIELFIGGKTNSSQFKTTSVYLPSLRNFNIFKYLYSYIKVKKYIKDVDIIHERFHVNPVDLFFLGSRKYLLEVNDPAPIIHSGLKGKIYRKIIQKKFQRADVIITQTYTMKKILSNFFKGKIFVVPNGVDIHFFENFELNFDVRKKYGIGKKEKIITFVGSFMKWHGVHQIYKIAKKIPNAKFLLVGDGPLLKEIIENKTDNMVIVGSLERDDIPPLLSQSDILIAPFNSDRFYSIRKYGFYWCPVKLFEYMASGKPIVTTNFNEIKKIVKNSAILCGENEINKFSDAIGKLISDSKLRKKLGQRGRTIAGEKYGWEHRAKEIIEIYNKML